MKHAPSVVVWVAMLALTACSSSTDGTASPGGAGSGGDASGSGGNASGSGGNASGSGGNASGSGGNASSSGGKGGAVNAGGSAGVHGLAACPDAPPVPAGHTTCRTSADCPVPNGSVCQPDVAFGCGVGPPPALCNSDSNCTGGQICLQVTRQGCSSEGNHCVPPCTSTSCAADEICAASGHCAPEPCAAGFVCAPTTVCGASKPGADAHGCAPASCATDGYACSAGFDCVASSHADAHGCTDVSCKSGFACPVNTDCNATSTAPHQCEPRVCKSDVDCDCGACIGGLCRDGLYICSMLAA